MLGIYIITRSDIATIAIIILDLNGNFSYISIITHCKSTNKNYIDMTSIKKQTVCDLLINCLKI